MTKPESITVNGVKIGTLNHIGTRESDNDYLQQDYRLRLAPDFLSNCRPPDEGREMSVYVAGQCPLQQIAMDEVPVRSVQLPLSLRYAIATLAVSPCNKVLYRWAGRRDVVISLYIKTTPATLDTPPEICSILQKSCAERLPIFARPFAFIQVGDRVSYTPHGGKSRPVTFAGLTELPRLQILLADAKGKIYSVTGGRIDSPQFYAEEHIEEKVPTQL